MTAWLYATPPVTLVARNTIDVPFGALTLAAQSPYDCFGRGIQSPAPFFWIATDAMAWLLPVMFTWTHQSFPTALGWNRHVKPGGGVGVVVVDVVGGGLVVVGGVDDVVGVGLGLVAESQGAV